MRFFVKKFLIIFFSIALMITGCGKKKIDNQTITIAYDASWAMLGLEDQQPLLTGFVQDLFAKIAKEEKKTFSLLDQSDILLLPGLREQKYDGIISIVEPTNFREAKMEFSEVFLETGPVLVVRESSKIASIEKIKKLQIGVVGDHLANLVSRKAKEAYITPYVSIAEALNDLSEGQISGVVMNRIHAFGYVNNLYQSKLKIIGDSLSDDGLRVVTMKDNPTHLIKVFHKGWQKLKEEGMIKSLLNKWHLIETN